MAKIEAEAKGRQGERTDLNEETLVKHLTNVELEQNERKSDAIIAKTASTNRQKDGKKYQKGVFVNSIVPKSIGIHNILPTQLPL